MKGCEGQREGCQWLRPGRSQTHRAIVLLDRVVGRGVEQDVPTPHQAHGDDPLRPEVVEDLAPSPLGQGVDGDDVDRLAAGGLRFTNDQS